MDKDYLLLRRAALSRSAAHWSDDDYDVLANGEAVGRIFKANRTGRLAMDVDIPAP
jgi:hypothetical protein